MSGLLPGDGAWMRRALELAPRGWGRTSPNPMVGCVLVRGGEVVGEGWHAEYGGPHAEQHALVPREALFARSLEERRAPALGDVERGADRDHHDEE